MADLSLRRLRHAVARRLPGRAAVLSYHRVGRAGCDPWRLTVSPEHFDQQLETLRRVGTVERLETLVGRTPLRRLSRRRPTFAVTFDDGYVDNLDRALPLLERHDVPATVFIAVGFVGEPAFWWDVLAHVAYGSGGDPGELARAAERAGIVVEQSPPAPDLDGIHLQLYEAVRALPAGEINVALARLGEELGAAPVPSQRPMTPAELRRLSAHPLITVGAHTVMHPRLTHVDPLEVRGEMTSSRHELGQLLGAEPTAFAYPYGAASDAVAAVAHDVGYTTAVTTSGRWLPVRPNRLLVGRLDPGDRRGDEFEIWLRHWA